MSGIDTSAAALLVNRTGALSPVGTGASAGATQAGVSALAGGAPGLPDVAGAAQQQQASAQTALSAIALALDAIQRAGGDATPAVVGSAPVWADPAAAAAVLALDVRQAADAMLASLAGTAAGDAAGAGGGGALPAGGAAARPGGVEAANAANGANAAAGGTDDAPDGAATATAAARVDAPLAPLAALVASLQRTVSGSGLFYESHLAQWLHGQRSPAELAAEPQNRLVAPAAPLPSDWRRGAGAADDVLWSDPHQPDASAAPARGGNPANPANLPNSAHAAQATLFDDGLLDALSASPAAARGDAGAPPSANPPGQPFAVHPALLPLLRQQLDVLATGEFRWTGDAWPGVRLDWSIRDDGDDAHRGRADPDTTPWRTRLTLSLPSLGFVDAELTLVGATLAVRVQASAAGAARLAADGDALRGRMAAAGLELGGLSIREVDGGAPGGGPGAARAAHAYARAAAAATPAGETPPPADPDDLFDWDAR